MHKTSNILLPEKTRQTITRSAFMKELLLGAVGVAAVGLFNSCSDERKNTGSVRTSSTYDEVTAIRDELDSRFPYLSENRRGSLAIHAGIYGLNSDEIMMINRVCENMVKRRMTYPSPVKSPIEMDVLSTLVTNVGMLGKTEGEITAAFTQDMAKLKKGKKEVQRVFDRRVGEHNWNMAVLIEFARLPAKDERFPNYQKDELISKLVEYTRTLDENPNRGK